MKTSIEKILHTDRLTLRPVTTADVTAIFEYSKNPRVGENAGWEPHADIRETRQVPDNDCYAIIK